MTGPDYLHLSHAYVRGYLRGHQHRPHHSKWAKIWTFLAFVLFGVALGVTWTAAEVALRNASIGDLVPRVIIGKYEAWNRLHRPASTRSNE